MLYLILTVNVAMILLKHYKIIQFQIQTHRKNSYAISFHARSSKEKQI